MLAAMNTLVVSCFGAVCLNCHRSDCELRQCRSTTASGLCLSFHLNSFRYWKNVLCLFVELSFQLKSILTCLLFILIMSSKGASRKRQMEPPSVESPPPEEEPTTNEAAPQSSTGLKLYSAKAISQLFMQFFFKNQCVSESRLNLLITGICLVCFMNFI